MIENGLNDLVKLKKEKTFVEKCKIVLNIWNFYIY